jgi:hypothetical protein
VFTVLAGLAAASTALAGCQWGENGLARLMQINPMPDAGAAADASGCDLPNASDAGPTAQPSQTCLGLISGQWAVRLVQFDNISPLGPPAWNLTITDLFLAQLSSDKTSLDLTFCGEESQLTDSYGDPQTIGQNIVPDAAVGAIAATPLPVPLPGNGTLVSSDVVWLWGVHDLASPLTTPLPTTADAATVFDQDEDGHPGVTVDVVSPQGEIYLVKRAIFDFMQGTIADGWITGPLGATLQQNILGASTSVLEVSAPITARTDCSSVYQLSCVAPGFTCASLLESYQTMFVGAPN